MRIILKFFVTIICATQFILPCYAVVSGIFVGTDENGVNISNTTLLPNQTYSFPLLISIDKNAPIQATISDFNKQLLGVFVDEDSVGLQSVQLVTRDKYVYLDVTTKHVEDELTHKNNIVVRYTDTSNQNLAIVPTISVGYQTIAQAAIDEMVADDYVMVSANAPFITKTQFEQIAQTNNYENTTFTGDHWRYNVELTNMATSNLVYNQNPDITIAKSFPENDMTFYNFNGNPDFTNTGTLTLDIASIQNPANEYYLYRTAYGNLYPLKFELDEGNMEISFNTAKLTHYVISSSPMVYDQATNTADESLAVSIGAMYNPVTGNAGQPIQMAACILGIGGVALAVFRWRK